MKHFHQFIALIALVGVITACNNQPATTTTELAVPVSVTDIKPGSIEKVINTTGTLNATKTTVLKTEMTGKYRLLVNPRTHRPFALGDVVENGQVIIQLEDAEYVNGIGLESKRLNLEISEQNMKKQQSLFEKGGVTQLDYRNSEVSYTNAKDAFERANLQLAKMNVQVPFKGVITDLPAITNSTQVASGTSVVSLMDYNIMTVEVNLPEKYITDVVIDQTVRIMNYTLPNDTLHGSVKELSPAISTETRTFKGVIQVANPDLKLRPGMFAKADIVLARKDSVIVIPKDIIISGQRGKTVFIVENGTANEKRITLGYETQDKAEITSGLKMNDRLVIKGFETLKNRSKVKIVK
ncbi:MAG: efflux RND transporter periplasmic adaptor subunit [Bacteroidota bacterium]|nr:efflux transporter periplasmic adaptor subunit [Odoribacter sp.]MDP3644317.1 efflux RND transporter periplasmic adaptor subunit [Bacteroidota bacterium]